MVTVTKEMTKVVFKALVEECSDSKYNSAKGFGWEVRSGAMGIELGLRIGQEEFNAAYTRLVEAGFVERKNTVTKFGGMFTFKPTQKGLDRLKQVC